MSNARQQFRLGLVGYDEIGGTLVKSVRGAGLQTIESCDKYAFDGSLIYKHTLDAMIEKIGRSARGESEGGWSPAGG